MRKNDLFLVAGASGDVGAEVVRALRERGGRVRALVRTTPLRSDADGVETVAGDLGDRASLERALEGVTAAFFVTPHHRDEERLGRTFVEVCESARVRRIVFSGAIHAVSESRVGRALLEVAVGLIGSHYRPKLRVEARVRASSAEHVILLPSNFYQNDAMLLSTIRAGSYPQPIGSRGMNRVDCRDIGDAAARALVGEVPPGSYALVGPDEWTGASCAAAWAEALGRDVCYAGDDIAAWRELAANHMNAPKLSDFSLTYGVIQRHGYRASARELERTHAVLGRQPRTYEGYIRDLLAAHDRPEHRRAA